MALGDNAHETLGKLLFLVRSAPSEKTKSIQTSAELSLYFRKSHDLQIALSVADCIPAGKNATGAQENYSRKRESYFIKIGKLSFLFFNTIETSTGSMKINTAVL